MADATAQSTIKSYGFNVGTVTYDYSDSVEKGMVISQTVEPGTKASAGTSISITVSNGPKPEEKIEVQSFVGQQESALKSWASQKGLYTNISDSQYSDSYAKGCIISMTPSSGTVSKGGTISYVISLGSKSQEVITLETMEITISGNSDLTDRIDGKRLAVKRLCREKL